MDNNQLLELFKKEQYQDIVEAEIDSGDFNSVFLKIRSLDFLGKYNSAYREYRINERTLLTGNFKEAVKLFVLIAEHLKLSYRVIINYLQLISMYEFLSPGNRYDLERYIANFKRKYKDKIFVPDISNCIAALQNPDPNIVLTSLLFMKTHIPKNEQKMYVLPRIQDILKSRREFDLNYALLFESLYEFNDDSVYFFSRNGKYFACIPNELKVKKEEYRLTYETEIEFALCYTAHDEGMMDYQVDLYRSVRPLLFPNYLTTKVELASLAYAIYEIATNFYRMKKVSPSNFYLKGANRRYINYYKKMIVDACRQWHLNHIENEI